MYEILPANSISWKVSASLWNNFVRDCPSPHFTNKESPESICKGVKDTTGETEYHFY